MARFVLGVRGMRRSLACALAFNALIARASIARAVDVRSELTIGREFVYLTGDVEQELVDGQLALGAGLTMVSDYRIERYGAQGLVEYRGDHVSAGVAAAFAPRQAGRGWASLDPHAELQWALGRARLRGDGGVLLRRVDAALRRTTVAVDQLQLHAEVEIEWNDRWRIAASALCSFYDPDPAAPRMRGADLGLAVSLAGKPERWAAGATLGRRVARPVWVGAAASAVDYADGSGVAAVPRVALTLGPWRGIGIEASGELVVPPAPSAASLRAIGGVALEYER